MSHMPNKDLNTIKEQLHIIQDKQTEDEVRKYASSLHASKHPDHIKEPLFKAVNVRIEEITRPLPMAVNGDLDDIE